MYDYIAKTIIETNKKKTKNIFINFSDSDIYKIDYRALKYIEEASQYSCYGIKFLKAGTLYYIYQETESDREKYKDYVSSIQEVNGYIRALYKIYHKMIKLND